MLTMYPGMVNSPITELAAAIDDVQTTITVVDGTKLPDAPNLAIIGFGEDAETILYTEKTGNVLSGVTRGFQGVAKAWGQGARIARFFTEYDQRAMMQNIQENADNIAAQRDNFETRFNQIEQELSVAQTTFEQNAVYPVYNVKGFGAKGDGVTDDTAAIQAAIDAAYSSGKGVVFIPPGEYVVSSTINTKGVPILGSGMYSTILHYTGAGYCLQSPTPTPVFGYGTISNLRIKGDNQGKGILLDNTHEGFIEHVFFADLDVGIELINSYTNRIDKCRFYNTDIGVLLGTASNAIALTNLIMGNCSDCGILIKNGSGIWINNSQFENSGAGVKCIDSADSHPFVNGLVLNMCYGEALTNGFLYVSFTETSAGSRIFGLSIENCYIHQTDTANYGINIENVSPSAVRGSLSNVFIFNAVTAGVRITRGHIALNNVWHWDYSSWAEKTLLSSDSSQVTVLKSSTDIIQIEKGFFKHNVPGAGYRVVTPDGTKTYEIYVDDTGAVVAKLV